MRGASSAVWKSDGATGTGLESVFVPYAVIVDGVVKITTVTVGIIPFKSDFIRNAICGSCAVQGDTDGVANIGGSELTKHTRVTVAVEKLTAIEADTSASIWESVDITCNVKDGARPTVDSEIGRRLARLRGRAASSRDRRGGFISSSSSAEWGLFILSIRSLDSGDRRSWGFNFFKLLEARRRSRWSSVGRN